MISPFLGGLGLFLTGMWLMTDGLKLAAGDSLRHILHSWTNSRQRGLATGFFITALVQSSSAVTVATIGFANAGLLSLQQAVWVIFGSNVGTTMTGWLVAMIGFKINLETYALPLIGIGMLIRVSGSKTRRAAYGQTLLGFGLFFLGIGFLKEAFESIGAGVELPTLKDAGLMAIFLYLLLGMVLTTLMQSSSAAIVITLSAAEGGMIPLGAAAATVIGANLGTTTTAILSVIGATATAKRVAASHVIFNLITATVALMIIVPMLNITEMIISALELTPSTATKLAIFHTIFNVLGVLLMWPVTDKITRFLAGKFISREELGGKPRFLDNTALEIPALALHAVMQEINGMNRRCLSVAMDAISAEGMQTSRFANDQAEVHKLAGAIGDYVARLSRTDLPENVAAHLPEVIMIVQQYVSLVEMSQDIVNIQKEIRLGEEQAIIDEVNNIKKDAVWILKNGLVDNEIQDVSVLQLKYDDLDNNYNRLRFNILKAGAEGRLGMMTVDNQLDQVNTIKRIVKHAVRAVRMHSELSPELGFEQGDTTIRDNLAVSEQK